MGDWTGTVPTILAGYVVTGDDWKTVLDIETALTSAPTSYTPTWTSSGTQPAIGDGTLSGAYTRIGKLVAFRFSMIAGASTTFGTGSWAFALPATISVPVVLDYGWSGTILDSGTALYPAWGIQSGNTVDVRYSNAGVLNGVTNTAPMTWTTNDRILMAGWYWAA